jgi:sulfoxide reductase heme-binding subunit YedZ
VLWYASRATGVVALLLLTAVLLLGLLITKDRALPTGGRAFRTGGSPPPVAPRPRTPRGVPDQKAIVSGTRRLGRSAKRVGLPAFAVTGLHRNLSLLSMAFVTVHVLTAVTDGFVDIPLTAAVVPLTSPYERLWLGLGAVSLDLMLAAVVTSLLRGRLSRRVWRAVHLTAYLSWPVAWVHSVWSSGDLQTGPLLGLAVACAAVVMVAAGWRAWTAAGALPRAERVGLLMTALHAAGRPR